MISIQSILKRKGHSIYNVSPDATVYDALQAMADHNCGALVVFENGTAIGMLSERDYARKVILMGKFSKDTPVRDIMTRNVISVEVDASVERCMSLMTERRVRHLVVRDGERIAGVISIGDVVKAVIDDQKFTIEQLEHYIHGSA